jgi:lipoprotein-anchoring transpeptidase ErfK/SrfK
VLPIRRILLVLCLGALAVGAAPAAATPPLPTEQIAAGVKAGGVDLSGLTVDAAAAKLEAVRASVEQGVVKVVVADLPFKLDTADASVTLDTAQTAKRALYAGRAAGGAPVDVALAVSQSREAVDKFTASISKRLRREPRDARVIITLRRVKVTHSAPGRDIDAAALSKLVSKAIADPRLPRLFKPRLVKVKPKITAAAAAKTASTVITIDQSAFKLRLFKHGKVVKTYGVAVGQPKYPTPNGRFAIQSKQVNPVWSVPNSPWAGELGGSTVAGGSAANPLKARWMGVSGSVGIHGTGEDYSIGSRASHGCIRMHVADVVKLFERVPIGTPVLIAP